MVQTAATNKTETDKPENPLEKLSILLETDMKRVNQLILKHMKSDIPMIPQLAGHLIAAGGKRVRPLLAVAAAQMFDYDGEDHCKLASCVEFIHTATLLHDDVIDESEQRRGKASAHVIFGNEAAVLVGDFLFSRAFQLMVEIGSLPILKILSNASATISEGEVLQLTTTGNTRITREDYLNVIRAKTAELFAASCEAGALAAGGTEEECAALRSYGENLGIAFQMVDDILDYRTPDAALGKNTGDDFREGKMTLPVVLLLKSASEEEKEFFEKAFLRTETQKTGDFEKACTLMEKYGIFEKALHEAESYGQQAKDALTGFDKNPEITSLLSGLIDFVINRRH
ncbi:MAG: polyprenyl synthetase family protein [Alphaproteobacteria bacterium]|nr:MAG: polyprenyl synthetase family protein [Alphaproteobacteria bacterium]